MKKTGLKMRLAGAALPAIVLFACLPLFFAQRASAASSRNGIKDAIVKIYTVKNAPDYYNPWRMLTAESISGSGSILPGQKILTNAHVVADHTFIQVRRHGQQKKYTARLLSVSHEADLALLTVDDRDFFSGVKGLRLGDLPQTQQEVLVYGFPFGGDTLSITKGVLSRIEHQFYTHSSHYLLAGQIDAAINQGNSGGPVLVNNRIVGVVMQSYNPEVSENIGYMVPTPVIAHFLEDMSDGRYDGFPALGLSVQKMENPHMKRRFGLPENLGGVVVNHIFPESPAEGKIQVDDILLAVDGHPIADDQTVEFRPREYTSFTYYIDMHQMGEPLRIDIMRRGRKSTVTMPLSRTREAFLLVPLEQYDRMPRFYIFGGIVFSPLSKNLIKRWGNAWRKKAPQDLVVALEEWPSAERRQVVVAIQTLAADINRGFHDLHCWRVESVNGKPFKDFDEFFKMVSTSSEPYVVFKDSKGYQVVIDRIRAAAAGPDILQTYYVKEDRSRDLPAPGQDFSGNP